MVCARIVVKAMPVVNAKAITRATKMIFTTLAVSKGVVGACQNRPGIL